MCARPLVAPHRSALLEARARHMRFNPSPAEEKLFSAISAGKLGVVVHRQVVVGRYIADLLVPAAHLIIEVDGTHHCRRVAADARRDRALVRMGYRVLRIEAELVRNALPVAVARVRDALGL